VHEDEIAGGAAVYVKGPREAGDCPERGGVFFSAKQAGGHGFTSIWGVFSGFAGPGFGRAKRLLLPYKGIYSYDLYQEYAFFLGVPWLI